LASPADLPALGLRERKKARTRAAIQRHALRLFRDNGYEATTVSQIADAAEISESTFFRYFPSKEELVLWDDFDPRIIESLEAQPPEMTTIQALRAAFREVVLKLSEEEQAGAHERMLLMVSIAPLRAAMIDQAAGPLNILSTAIAKRSGRAPDDASVRALVGGILGVGLMAMLEAADDPTVVFLGRLDDILARLEQGLDL
jgi:AcrR family transcriptional regulator